jgi:hypothetical protein
MEEKKLKHLLSLLKDVVNELESEIYSNIDNYKISESDDNFSPERYKITDYDEVFEDDDGYPD